MFTSGLDPKPFSSPIDNYLARLHTKYSGFQEGSVADYIPELAKANPDWFGICIATRDGHVYEAGDTRQRFTIQSISKALAYGLALEDRGEDYILSRISVEPSGDAFNAISLKSGTGMPFNPMINAGAIATCGQIQSKGGLSRFDRILAYLSACAGRSLDIDTGVYQSESSTGHRNRAIGWMLRNFDIINEEPTDILETYFQQCSIRVNCRDLALMGATLANQGRNPLTKEQAIQPDFVDNILSVMSSCGMYDYSGEWLYRVGLPAKSGVGGGILAVLPGQLGIGIFSPALDAQGNSARGIKVCEDLAHELALHQFSNGSAPQPSLRLSYDGSQVSSCRRRSPQLQQTLRAIGHRIRVLELQGELIFSTFEPVVRLVLKRAPYCQFLILDLQNTVNIDDVSLKLIGQLHSDLLAQGVQIFICNMSKFSRLFRRKGLEQIVQFGNEDTALEHCENLLLQQMVGSGWNVVKPVSLMNHSLLGSLSEQERSWLDIQMDKGEAVKGDYLIRAGDAGDCLFLLLTGSVEVRLPSETGQAGNRVDVFEAGMCFGEMGFLDGSPRSADVVALDQITFRVLTRQLFDRLDNDYPQLKIKLLQQLSSLLSANLRKSNAELAAYKG